MTTPTTRYTTFKDFWPFYLGEHSLPATRWMHFVGSTIAVSHLISCLLNGAWAFAPLALVWGYGFAWVSHFFIEKNRPATFTYPLWSLAGDWKMWAMMLTFQLKGELDRLGIVPKDRSNAVSTN